MSVATDNDYQAIGRMACELEAILVERRAACDADCARYRTWDGCTEIERAEMIALRWRHFSAELRVTHAILTRARATLATIKAMDGIA